MRAKVTPSADATLRLFHSAHPRTRIAVAVAAALSGSLLPVAHYALAAETDANDGALAEIVVTSRKRAENLQDVPISIDVYTSKDLQNRAISQFEDYATITPSISFVSAGPGTQTFVMRGVSDGSNSNYSNTASTLFLVDDMSMNYFGTTPDLHLYDIDRIEVLNGPQGTTFGAGAMAGALRFITNKPDATAFSAGMDLQYGKIDGGTHNTTYEGFINIPVIPDWTAIRLSVFNDYHGGYVNNIKTTRTWANQVVSDNSAWSGNNYNVEKVTGARIALGQKLAEGWNASLTWSYQKQLTHGAWDQDPTIGGGTDPDGNLLNGPARAFGRQNVARFGPEFKQYYAKTLDLHVDGDVGIGDLVFASTYWAQDDRWVNEYSEYMQYYNHGGQQKYDCLTDPINGAGYSGCGAPTQYFDIINHIQRWSNELRLQSKAGGRVHWVGGAYWERTKNLYSDYYHMPSLQVNGQAYQATVNYYAAYYGTAIQPPPAADDWYSYVGRSDYLQVTEFGNVQLDILPNLTLEAGTVHFHSNFNSGTYGGFWYTPEVLTQNPGSSSKWNSKAGISWKVTPDLLLYGDWSQGFRDGGSNSGLPATCKAQGLPNAYTPDTVTNWELGWKSSMLDHHLVWDGAAYYMPWKNLQSNIFNPDLCPSSSFNANIGDARVYGMESDVKWQPNAFFSMDVSASYNDSRLKTVLTQYEPVLQVLPGERLPYVPYFSWSANARYERPVRDSLHGYVQYDIAHKGDMWNTLSVAGSNNLPRVLQPGYSVMNLRLGLTELNEHWTGEFFITNLTNKNAIIFTNEGNFDLRETINEPRVFGLRLSYRYGKQGANTAD